MCEQSQKKRERIMHEQSEKTTSSLSHKNDRVYYCSIVSAGYQDVFVASNRE